MAIKGINGFICHIFSHSKKIPKVKTPTLTVPKETLTGSNLYADGSRRILSDSDERAMMEKNFLRMWVG